MASSLPQKNKLAVGLLVDGLDVKFVCLEKTPSGVRIKDYRTGRLVNKLDEARFIETDLSEIPVTPAETPSFDLEQETSDKQMLERETVQLRNESVLQDLLSPYFGEKYSITYSITEPEIEYHFLDTDFGLKGKKLKARVVEELGNLRAVPPAQDAVSIVEINSGSLICIVREDGLHLANLIHNIKDSIGQRIPRLPLIDSVEMSLMNAIRLNYSFESDEHTLVIYVGQEFTRLIFMRGMDCQHIAPVIAEGIDAANIEVTIYSRAILEQNNIGIQKIDRVILAGESHKIQLHKFNSERFDTSDVSYIRYNNLDTGLFSPETADELSEYAVPIASAWKVLEPRHPMVYQSNLLPSHLAQEQKYFRLGWHGYLLFALIFLATLFYTVQIPSQQQRVGILRSEVNFKETQILEVEQMQASIDGVRNEIRILESAVNLYEELVPAYDRWSKTLTHVSMGVEDINSLWILDVQSRGDHGRGLEINGYSIYRSRIPRFANLFDNAILQEVLVQEIRGRIVYRFKIIVEDTGLEIRPRTR